MERVRVRAARPMSLRRVLPAALFALVLLAPLVAASGASPPAEATRVDVANRTAYHWLGNATNGTGAFDLSVLAEVEPGAAAALHVATLMDRQDANATAIVWFVNVTSEALSFENASASTRKEYGETPVTSEAFHFAAFAFTAPSAEGTYGYDVTFEGYADENGTLVPLGSATSVGTVVVAAIDVPLPPVGPTTSPLLWTGLALMLLGVLVVGGFAAKRRADRRRMNAAPKRSQVMRDMELERKLERAKEKDPDQAQVIQQEIRAQEHVREKRRELQILEAKRADALKTIDLLRKRHEAGGLTKLQFDNMVAKKQADLARIEAEIAQMEAEDARGGSAAA